MHKRNMTRKGYPLPDPPVDRCGSSAGHFLTAQSSSQPAVPSPLGVARVAPHLVRRPLALCSEWLFWWWSVLAMLARPMPTSGASLHSTVPPRAKSQGHALATQPTPLKGFPLTVKSDGEGHRLSACQPSKRSPQLKAIRWRLQMNFRITVQGRTFSWHGHLPEAQTGRAGCHTTSVKCRIDDPVRDASRPALHGVDLCISFPNCPMGNSTKPNAKAARVPNNQPIETFRLRGISASIFANQTDDGQTFHRVSIVRTYRDSDGQFQTTSAFSRDDLPIVAHIADEAWQFIMELEQEQRSNTNGD